MPKKKSLTENAAPPASTAPSGILDGPPSAVRAEAMGDSSISQQTRMPHDSLAGVTTALGAALWSTGKRFDWARAANRHHYDFTRYYFRESVLVDVFPNANPSTRKEVEQRGACVAKFNETAVRKIGYLAIVKSAQIPPEAFTAVLAGEVLPLVERATEGVLA